MLCGEWINNLFPLYQNFNWIDIYGIVDKLPLQMLFLYIGKITKRTPILLSICLSRNMQFKKAISSISYNQHFLHNTLINNLTITTYNDVKEGKV